MHLLSSCNREKPDVLTSDYICDSQLAEESPMLNSNWTWFDIEVGRSTPMELVSNHGEPLSKRSFKFATGIGCTYQYEFENVGSVLFIITGGRIREIDIDSPGSILYGDDRPVFLRQLVNLYGMPELVGFDKGREGSRIVVWIDDGVQASIRIGNVSSINGTLSIDIRKAILNDIRFFTPVKLDEYFDSIHSRSYGEIRPGGDDFDPYPQDPFDWNN
jgi:hypothetical protein